MDSLVWTCPKDKKNQCRFFVWVEHEAEAKEWLKRSNPQSVPKTPTRKGLESDDPRTPAMGLSDLPKLLDTPFTKAKRKPVSREALDEHENKGPRNQNLDDSEGYMQDNAAMGSPSRKATKAARFSTPGQTFNEKLTACSVPLPTPDSGSRPVGERMASEPRLRQPVEISPTPARLNSAMALRGDRKADLTTTVLKLIRSDSVELKESTELQIRHEIDLELDLNAARMQRYEETISKLYKRLDALETTVGHLTAGGAVNERVELSD